MKIEDWLESACADADRRGLPELKPLLASLARSTANLRGADNPGDAPTDAPAGEERPPHTTP